MYLDDLSMRSVPFLSKQRILENISESYGGISIKEVENSIVDKMAELILNTKGVSAVFQSAACTYELKNEFYSYRREAQTGRMVTLIWFNDRELSSSTV